MTIRGTAGKTMILLVILTCAAGFSWKMVQSRPDIMFPVMIGSLIGGLVLCLATCFKPFWSPYTAPLYALAEGILLGVISLWYSVNYGNALVIQAISLTLADLFLLLLAYQSGWIKATEKFKLGVFAATGAIALVYIVSMVLRLFNMEIPLIHSAGWVGIAFSVVVVIVASLNLILDFDLIERGAEVQAPKSLEWYGGFALLVTLVWLYLEILRLLAKLNSRD